MVLKVFSLQKWWQYFTRYVVCHGQYKNNSPNCNCGCAYFKGGQSSLVDGDDEPTDTKSGLGIGGNLQLYCPSKKRWESKPSVSKALKLIASMLFKHQLTWFSPIF